MNEKRWLLLTVFPSFILAGVGFWLLGVSAQVSGSVSGVVVDTNGPIAGATVRIRATENVTATNVDGRFRLRSLAEGERVEVTAWYDGYYIAGVHVTPTISGLTITLRPYHTEDHPGYEWTSPITGTSPGACGNCHPPIISQWQNNAHGTAIANPRFFSLYNGTDLSGTVQIGPGYQNDFPGTAGVCANCHSPAAGVDGYLTTNMNDVRDVITAGIHCDYCHKVGGAYLDPATQSVYPNAPGAQSQRLLRPPPGDNIFFGPYDDVKDPDTFLPLITQSQFCAPCHQFTFWGTPIYESYEEWLASPYADAGVTCQDCHMPPNGDTYFALPEVGGLEHPPEKIPSHLQPGARDVALLQDTVTLTLSARQVIDEVHVTVTITNTGAGHDVPTDFPGRHMILTVSATDGQSLPLARRGGPIVPEWGGPQAGLPGVAYAKVLRDVETGEMPIVSYWKRSVIASDNRIAALGVASSVYTFTVPLSGEEVQVTARLIFRRLFYELAAQKGWSLPDVVMVERSSTVSLRPPFYFYLPLATAGS